MLDLSSDEITSEPTYKVLAILTLPLLAQNLVESASLIIDLFWIGRLDEEAVGAVGMAFPLTSLLLIAAIGVPYIGTMILVSQRMGADDEAGARSAAFNGTVLGGVLGLVLGGLAYLAAPWLVEFIVSIQPNTSGAITDLTVSYFRILALGMSVAAMSDAIEASFVARGDSRAALYLSVVTVGTIMIADPVLIFGLGPFPAMGVDGAALATVLGYVTGLALAVGFVLVGRNGGVITRDDMSVDLDVFRDLYDRGFAPTAQQANRRVVEVLVMIIVFAAGGAAALAAYLVGSRVFSIASIPADGFQSSTQTVVGQNLGANKPDRAARSTWVGAVLVGVLLTLFGAVQWLFPGTITNILAPEVDGAAFELTIEFLRILAICYPAFGAVYAFQGGFNGASRGEVSFRSSVVQYWALQIPLAAGLGLLLDGGATGVFWAISLSNILIAILLGSYLVYVNRGGMFKNAAQEASEDAAAS